MRIRRGRQSGFNGSTATAEEAAKEVLLRTSSEEIRSVSLHEGLDRWQDDGGKREDTSKAPSSPPRPVIADTLPETSIRGDRLKLKGMQCSGLDEDRRWSSRFGRGRISESSRMMKSRSADMIRQFLQDFPVGTPVIVKEQSKTGRGTIFTTAETMGTVFEWRHEPTGAWYAQAGDPSTPNSDGKLQLLRLRLRKLDGELTDLVIDDLTTMAKLEAQLR